MSRSFGGLLVVVLMVSSCKPTLKVSCQYDKTVDFSRFKSFTLSESESMVKALNQLNYDRVLDAIRNEMSKKGFSEVAATPDIILNVSAIVNNKATVSSTSYYEYGSVYRPYTWGPGVDYTDYDVRHYKDGSLVIDVVDAGAGKLLWQGIGYKEMDTPLKHPEKDILKAIESVMADFPPRTQK